MSADHDHDDMLWRSDAVERILSLSKETIDNQATESIGTDDPLTRSMLAEDVIVDSDVPAHNYATIDGFAFDARESYPLTVHEDEIFPEDEPPELEPGEAVCRDRGTLPERANAVLKVEETVIEGDQLHGTVINPGTYIYERESNVEAGETLLVASERLSAKDVVLLP